MRAICIGEAMVELRGVGADRFARSISGDAYNTAVYLKRSLGAEASVSFLTAIGEDPMSLAMHEDFLRQNLLTDLVFSVPERLPGLYLIEVDASGERSFHYWRSASAARLWLLQLEHRGAAEALSGDLLFISGISLAILSDPDRGRALDLLAAVSPRVARLAFDPNVRPKLWRDLPAARAAVEAACAVADIVLPSLEDGLLIWGETDPHRQLQRYRACGAREIALTLGAAGAMVWDGEVVEAIPWEPAAVLDTSGAGDSFNGGYLAARLRGLPPKDAAQAGLELAGRVVGAAGALIPASLSHPQPP